MVAMDCSGIGGQVLGVWLLVKSRSSFGGFEASTPDTVNWIAGCIGGERCKAPSMVE